MCSIWRSVLTDIDSEKNSFLLITGKKMWYSWIYLPSSDEHCCLNWPKIVGIYNHATYWRLLVAHKPCLRFYAKTLRLFHTLSCVENMLREKFLLKYTLTILSFVLHGATQIYVHECLAADVVTVSTMKAFKNQLEAHFKKTHGTVVRLTSTECVVHMYSLVFLSCLLFLLLSKLNRVHGYVPVP